MLLSGEDSQPTEGPAKAVVGRDYYPIPVPCTMAGLAILSLPSPSLRFRHCSPPILTSCKPLLASSSSSSVAQDDALPSSDSLLPPSAADVNFSGGCKACGREELERGCNGEGRIQGGIATVPGFGWWPIKAYRPCPGFVASGGRYRRSGQSMDEVAFGRTERVSAGTDEPQSSKEKQIPRKFKR